MKKIVLLVLMALLASGCASLDQLNGQLENALAPSLACDKVFMVSQYGPWGLSSKIRDKDARIICDQLAAKKLVNGVVPNVTVTNNPSNPAGAPAGKP